MEIREDRYAEAKRLIRQAMREKQLVLFVGAGVSKNSGMPSWDEAIKEFEDKFDFDTFNLGEFSDKTVLPQYYYNGRGQKEYTQLARKVFRYEDKLKTSDIHKEILKFNVDTIITTNYDHLIEQVGEENGVFFQVISQDADLPYRKGGKELIKMHGDFEHNNFVFKEDDYLHYSENFKLIENYIKSLIGTKVVLFIGYSLSDPDVKHIFSWTKDILRGHFQRAYMIVTGKKINMTEIDYYRNLGVNIIYATELLGEKIDFNDHKQQLIKTLEFLQSDDETDLIDFLYENLSAFSNLNYIYCKFIDRAFNGLYNETSHKIAFEIDNECYVNCFSNPPSNEEIKFLNELNKVSKDTNDTKNTKNAENTKSCECTRENQDGEETKRCKCIRKNRYREIKTIVKVLRNGNVKGITCYEENESKLKPIREDFSNDENVPEWICEILYFNYRSLKKRKEKNSKILSDEKPELYLEQAYISVFLSDYLTAYYCLKNAVNIFYQNRDYVWYYFALWNKYVVAQLIQKYSRLIRDIDDDILQAVKKDCDEINLERTLKTIPDLGDFHNQFLKDLKNFKFASDLFYDVTSYSRDVSTQAEQKYIIWGDLPAYMRMRQQVFDYYLYGIYNYLLVDNRRENNEIFHLFVRSMVESVSAPDKCPSNDSMFGPSGNIHATSFVLMDIHLILRYIQSADIRELFKVFKNNFIVLTDFEKSYFKRIIKNVRGVFELKDYEGKDVFWRCICFASYIKMDEEIAELIIKALINLPNKEYLFSNPHQAVPDSGELLTSDSGELVVNQKSPRNNSQLVKFDLLLDIVSAISIQELYNSEKLCKLTTNLIKRLLNLIVKFTYLLRMCYEAIETLVDFISKGKFIFDDENTIKELLSIKNTCHDQVHYCQLVGFIYDKSSDGVKKIIKDDFKEWEC